MSEELPKSTDANQIGRHGVTILQERLEREGWIFRRQDGDSDFGIDGEIEMVDRNRVTGRLVKCQVKSSASIDFDDSEASVQVNVTTYNLWRTVPLLTILFHVDTLSGAIYWTPALAHHPMPTAKSLSVRFEVTSDLRGGVGTLRSYLDSWFAVRAGDAILREIPSFHRIYEALTSHIDCNDDWCYMHEEQDDNFRLFYGHALRLRLEVGLSNVGLPTLDDWFTRNAGIWDFWDSGNPLLWGTFSEAMKIIGPTYEEALARLTERLSNAELTFENQDIWNFVKRHGESRYPQHIVIDERSSDRKFHARIEAKLKAAGALKYRFVDRKVR